MVVVGTQFSSFKSDCALPQGLASAFSWGGLGRAFQARGMLNKALTIAWISDFPVEWLPDLPPDLRGWPRRHPATWQMALLTEFAKNPDIRLHVVLLRKQVGRELTFEHSGAVFHVLPAAPWARLGSLFWLDTLLIRRLLRKVRPDLVHAWGTEKGSGLIAHRLGYPYLMTIQGLFSWYKELVPLSRYDRFVERIERTTLRRATAVSAESNYTIRYIQERYPQLQLFQVEHVPNRVFFGVRRQPQDRPLHLVSVGTLGFRKGTDLLFRALEPLVAAVDFKLTVITNPAAQFLEQARATVSEGLWRRMEFKHHLTPAEVAKELETPTLMLLPTRADTGPVAAKEAAVAGLPLVASAIGGVPDYVTPGSNGLTFPPGDLEAFGRAIRQAVSHPLLGRGMVEARTLARVREHLSPELMASSFLKAYRAVLDLRR